MKYKSRTLFVLVCLVVQAFVMSWAIPAFATDYENKIENTVAIDTPEFREYLTVHGVPNNKIDSLINKIEQGETLDSDLNYSKPVQIVPIRTKSYNGSRYEYQDGSFVELTSNINNDAFADSPHLKNASISNCHRQSKNRDYVWRNCTISISKTILNFGFSFNASSYYDSGKYLGYIDSTWGEFHNCIGCVMSEFAMTRTANSAKYAGTISMVGIFTRDVYVQAIMEGSKLSPYWQS